MSQLNESSIPFQPVKPSAIITNANADTNTVGANVPCEKALIRSHPGNTGVVWLNFGAVAVEHAGWPLSIGDGLEVALSNTNKINALFKTGNDKITVLVG